MKRVLAFVLALSMGLSLAACGGNPGAANTPAQNSETPAGNTPAQEEPVDVVVFAAASMEATLTEIAEL